MKAKSVAHRIDPRSIMPAPTSCRFCHHPVEYVSHAKIYGGREFSAWPYIYLCTNKACGASVGTHEGTEYPLGTLADTITKNARKNAHEAFDQIWKGGFMTRTKAYEWLAFQLDIERWRCHISWFDTEVCNKVVALSKAYLLVTLGNR